MIEEDEKRWKSRRRKCFRDPLGAAVCGHKPLPFFCDTDVVTYLS